MRWYRRLVAAPPVVELVAVVGLVEVDLWLLPPDRFWLRSLARGLAVSALIASFLRRRAAPPFDAPDSAPSPEPTPFHRPES